MKYGLRFPKRCPIGASFCTKKKALILLFLTQALLLGACGNNITEEAAPETLQDAGPVISITSETPEDTEKPDPEENPQEDEQPDPATAFYSTPISDELFLRMQGKSFKDDCTLPTEDLRSLHVLHKTIDGETKEGELVVNVHIAESVLMIFRELYENDYPIEKIRLIDEYDADDERSMEDNNTSCFNFRLVSDTNTVSRHGMGLAIDINPFYNPYVRTKDGEMFVEPAGAEAYADRTQEFPYKIDPDDLAYKLFTEHGFTWGGSWKNSKDYQHFEIPKDTIKEWYPDQ